MRISFSFFGETNFLQSVVLQYWQCFHISTLINIKQELVSLAIYNAWKWERAVESQIHPYDLWA